MILDKREACFINTVYGKLHPFQGELIEALLDPAIGLIRVEAPVGVGKTTVIRKAVELCENPVVATFPTTILIRTQAKNIISKSRVYQWPSRMDFKKVSYDLFLIEYSSQSLLDLAKENYPEQLPMTRGEILGNLLNTAPFVGEKTLVLTTPDVLWLIYKGKYKYSKHLREALSNAIVFFDEFHCYCDLANFYKLLQLLGEGRVAKVVLMSATPFLRDDIVIDFKGKEVKIDFVDEGNDNKDTRVFNYPLETEVTELEYYNLYTLAEFLKNNLVELPKPTAIIFDSIFRLIQVEPLLRKEFPDFIFFRYDGLKKQDISFNERTIILGTSSIEVGIDIDFSSLVFEGSSWTTAIQRLGRVGRKKPGKAILLSNRSFEPFKPEKENLPRSKFESILREYLPDPRSDWTSGELFRGDAPSFLLITKNGDSYVYGPGILSMYEIVEYDYAPKNEKSLEKILRDFRIRESDIPWVKLKNKLFPFAGVLMGLRLRDKYIPVKSVEQSVDEWLIRLENGELYRFEKEDILDD
jgi:CRISPR-associated helicase Cas3